MRRFAFVALVLILLPCIAFAHPGRTDSRGGHTDHSTGEYHYHHGYQAHQHPNGECPYNFNDASGDSSARSGNYAGDNRPAGSYSNARPSINTPARTPHPALVTPRPSASAASDSNNSAGSIAVIASLSLAVLGLGTFVAKKRADNCRNQHSMSANPRITENPYIPAPVKPLPPQAPISPASKTTIVVKPQEDKFQEVKLVSHRPVCHPVPVSPEKSQSVPSQPEPVPPQNDKQSIIVECVSRSRIYHVAGCSTIVWSLTESMELSDALAQGRRPCKICMPPTDYKLSGQFVYASAYSPVYHKKECIYVYRYTPMISLHQAVQMGKRPCKACLPPRPDQNSDDREV